MAKFAIVRDGTVINVIVAADEATAKAVTGLDVLPIVDGVPGMGFTLEAEGWRPPSPFPSWEWDGDAWQSPVPYPSDRAYAWDEGSVSWVEIPTPEPASEPAPEE